MIILQYVLFHIILLAIIVVHSQKLTHCNDKDYWKCCFPLLLSFSIEEGLRWGRDTDWNLYYNVYEQIKNGADVNFEFLFGSLLKNSAIIGLPYSIPITFCSFMWIFSLCYFIRQYKQCAKYFLPLCLLYFTVSVSNTFRWHLAMSFFLISLRNLMDGHWGKGIVFLVCTLGSHTAAFGMSLIGVAFMYWFRRSFIVKPMLVVAISILLILLFQIDFMRNVVSIFDMFATKRFEGYVNNAEHWFYSETFEGERKSLMQYLLLMTPFYVVLFISHRLQIKKELPDGYMFYNLLSFLIVFRSVTSGIELLQRMAMFYEFVLVLLVALIFHYKRNLAGSIRNLLIIVALFMIYKGYTGYFKLYDSEEQMKYVWNSRLMSPSEISKKFR